MELQELKNITGRIRYNIIKMLGESQSGHPGGSLSSAEIVTALYFHTMHIDPQNPTMEGRDRFVLSKGHAAPLLYATLAEKGFFPKEDLMGLRKLGSPLQGHPSMRKCPGVEASTGSLGQGVSIATGMALAAKKSGTSEKIYTLLGDGETQEGLVWEAAMAASHYKLDNLTVIVDVNGLQIDGKTSDVMSVGDLAKRFAAFGFHVIDLADGNDMAAVIEALDTPTKPGMPKAIIAHTVKGKGVSFMENQAGWHGKAPSGENLEKALQELEIN